MPWDWRPMPFVSISSRSSTSISGRPPWRSHMLCVSTHPPRGAFQDPVPSSSIVFAGDSAGTNLALALTHILLFARAQTVMFHGTKITLSFPASIAVLSADLELTLALPSFSSNRRLDIFSDTWSLLKPDYPTCEIWHSASPRGHPYREINMLLHPLVAPALAQNWEGRPAYVVRWWTGTIRWFSAKLAAERGCPSWCTGLGMKSMRRCPTTLPIMSATWPRGQKLRDGRSPLNVWNGERTHVEGFTEDGTVGTGAVMVWTEGGERKLDVRRLTQLEWEEVLTLVTEKQKRWKVFTGRDKSGVVALGA